MLKATQRFGLSGWLSLAMLAVFALCFAAPGLLSPHGPLEIEASNAFAPPSLTHLFGTDDSGRDILSRVIHGTRDSLTIGVVATLCGLFAGLALGTLAGGSERRALGPLRYAVDRLIEALFAFPGLLLALLLIAVRGPGVSSVIIAVAISTAPGFARMVRGGIRQALGSGSVEAARLQGDGTLRVWRTLVLPETMRPVLVLATLGIGHAVILAAALGFLGLGTPPPTPEWGAMLNAGRPYLMRAWWMTFFPGLAIVLIGVACTVLGRSIERRNEVLR
ncbi:ABC transporter permease [Leucobacter sp. UT-8R-CII-1-4]|uniref:ABC transporter permease n=1 Tax=Leucobacter sp. UT-8R-CII-1-4 TaxID=3040075 RepID=UPI0024A841BE|nr:ABC transporter permease [Leucobacter sp. UT-8R-CII-1-4]MDI6024583.1 ABC transporter permease [Leucobacter sp. UT-8R-CII-1-4]